MGSSLTKLRWASKVHVGREYAGPKASSGRAMPNPIPLSMTKRLLDVVGAGLGLIVLSPLFAFIAFLIKLDSPGPIYFAQERVGLCGKRFRFLKFRTMHDGVSDNVHRKFVSKMLTTSRD